MPLVSKIIRHVIHLLFLFTSLSSLDLKASEQRKELFSGLNFENQEIEEPSELEYGFWFVEKTHRIRSSTGYGFPAYYSLGLELGVEDISPYQNWNWGVRGGVWATIKDLSGNNTIAFQSVAIGVRMQPYMEYRWLQTQNISLNPRVYTNLQLGAELSRRHFINITDYRIFPHAQLVGGTGLSLRLYSVFMQVNVGFGFSKTRLVLENELSIGFVF